MAKSSRPEEWHDAYTLFVEKFGMFLTLDQASQCIGIKPRYVYQRYPYGWERVSKGKGTCGKGKGKIIRLDRLLDQVYGMY